MRILTLLTLLVLAGCSSQPTEEQNKANAAKAQPPKPADESRRFPSESRHAVEIVDHILNMPALPAGNLASYRQGDKVWQQFLVRTASDQQAAIATFDFKNALGSPKFIAHMGGYYGTLADQPVFVFPKGKWIAGIIGLEEKDADTLARQFALRLD